MSSRLHDDGDVSKSALAPPRSPAHVWREILPLGAKELYWEGVSPLTVDATLTGCLPWQAPRDLATQLGVDLELPECAPAVSLSPGVDFADTADWGVDFEAGGDPTIRAAWTLARRLAPLIRGSVAIIPPLPGLAWNPADEAFLSFLSEEIGAERVGLVSDPPGEPEPGALDPVVALAPGLISAETLAALGATPAGLVALRPGVWAAPPALRRRPDSVSKTDYDWLAIRAARLPWLSGYAQLHGSFELVRPAVLASEAELLFREGHTDLAIARLERLAAAAKTPAQRAAWLARLQGVRIGRLRFAEAAAEAAPPDCPDDLVGFLTLTQGWGKVMTGAPSEADRLFAEARSRFSSHEERAENLYVLNISALARARLGDLAAAEAIELEIEQALARQHPRRWALEYINAINLHRLYRLKKEPGPARRYLALAERANAGTRTSNDAIYTAHNLSRMAEMEGDRPGALAHALACTALFLAEPIPEALASRTIAGLLARPWPMSASYALSEVAASLGERLRALMDGAAPCADGPEIDALAERLAAVRRPASDPADLAGAELSEKGRGLMAGGVGLFLVPGIDLARGRLGPLRPKLRDLDDLRRLFGRCLIQLAPPSARRLLAEGPWSVVIDDQGGRGAPLDLAQLAAAALRLGVGRLVTPEAEAPLPPRLDGFLIAAIGPGVAEIEPDQVSFRRQRPPAPARADWVAALRTLQDSGGARPAAKLGLPLSDLRDMERLGFITLDLDPKVEPFLAESFARA